MMYFWDYIVDWYSSHVIWRMRWDSAGVADAAEWYFMFISGSASLLTYYKPYE